MDIAFAYDESYSDQARVAVESILVAHQQLCDVTVWILTTPEGRRRSEAAFERQARGRGTVRVIQADGRFNTLPSTDQGSSVAYVSNAMYLRLYLPEVLPESVDRFLYLDVDTMCLDDLRPLWNVPMSGHPLAAVPDAYIPTVVDDSGLPGAEGVLDPDAPYFNSGVLFVNAPLWREMKVSERCFDYLDEYRDRLRYYDQDALNFVLHRQWLPLAPEWNQMMSERFEPGHSSQPHDEHARIMHFVGPTKPWHEGFHAGVRRSRYLEFARSLGL